MPSVLKTGGKARPARVVGSTHHPASVQTPLVAAAEPDPAPRSILHNTVTILGEDLELVSEGRLVVNCALRADVKAEDLLVADQSRIEGTVVSGTLSVSGEVEGPVLGERVHLHSSARVIGDMKCQSLTMDAGAYFDGRLRTAPDEAERDAPEQDLDQTAA